MFSFTKHRPLPNFGIFGVHEKFTVIGLELTTHCANRCIFCPLHTDSTMKHGIMSLSNMEVVFQCIPDFSGRVVVSATGEAILLNDLPERCARIKAAWPKCTLDLISTLNIDRGAEYIGRLLASGIDSISISCYGHTQEDYMHLHGKDAFLAVCANMEYIKQAQENNRIGTNVKISAHLLRKTDKHFGLKGVKEKAKSFLDFAKNNNVTYSDSSNCYSWQGRIKEIPNPTVKPNYPCSVVWGPRAGMLMVAFNLDVFPCCYLAGKATALGNLRESTLPEIFASSVYRQFYEAHWSGDLSNFPLCGDCIDPFHSPGQDELIRMAAYLGRQLAGQKVFFWGCGETYRKYKLFFADTNPVAILLDTPGPHPEYVDGVPIVHPMDALSETSKLPLIIFASPGSNTQIVKSIKRNYPWYDDKDMILCVADQALFTPSSHMQIDEALKMPDI